MQFAGHHDVADVPGVTDGQELDGHVEEFRTWSLAESGPFTFIGANALVIMVREGGRVVEVHALVATGVDAAGLRQVVGRLSAFRWLQ